MIGIWKIIWALVQLAVAGAQYAKAKETTLTARQAVFLSLFNAMTETINEARKAGRDFDAELHEYPERLHFDDGFKRQDPPHASWSASGAKGSEPCGSIAQSVLHDSRADQLE